MADTENILQTIKTTIQDIVAPDVRELKVRSEATRDQITGLESRMNVRFDAIESRADAQFKSILSAIAQGKAENELSILRQLASLSERLAALEARRQ